MMHPERQAYVEEASHEEEDGVDINNIPVDRDYYMPSVAAGIAPEKASAILAQFDRKRRERAAIIPTDDKKVRAELRKLGEPITLFAERPEDRRQRLRELVTDLEERAAEEGEDEEMKDAVPAAEGVEEEGEEEFYTPGVAELADARKAIARYSILRVKARLAVQRQEANISLHSHIRTRKSLKENLQQVDLFGSQIAGERAVSITRFSPSGELIAAGNWGGGIKLLTVPNLEEKATLRGHTGQVGGISWLPGATLPSSGISSSSVNLASGAGEGDVHLWSLDKTTPLTTLSGHTGRVCRVEFHPSGNYLASASYDTTWRLWDINTSTELVLQEGHSAEVYTVAFNVDGSLLASGGLDSIGRIWDLRSGRTVMVLDGHIRPIYALDWGRDGYRVLSGSGDGWIKCWDLRKVRVSGSVGAHNGNVADVRWFKGNLMTDPNGAGHPGNITLGTDSDGKLEPMREGTFLVSGGFDNKVKIFSADDWALVKTLDGHAGNVLSVDVCTNAKWICSGGRDRTVKLWGCDNGTEF